jgi:hypothetical protein
LSNHIMACVGAQRMFGANTEEAEMHLPSLVLFKLFVICLVRVALFSDESTWVPCKKCNPSQSPC